MTASSVSAAVRDQLRTLVAGRTVVLATTHPAAGESILRQLHELGPSRILVLGPPALEPLTRAIDAELVEVDLADENSEDENSVVTLRRWEGLLDDPPSGLRNLLDARDPDHNALVLVSPWLTTVELLGRPVFGAQRPGWAGREDKMLADQLWEVAGIPGTSGDGVTHTEP